MAWWARVPRNSVHRAVLQLVPSLVLWNIWLWRNQAKYEGTRCSRNKLCADIVRQLHSILSAQFPRLSFPLDWTEIWDSVLLHRKKFSACFVKWVLPPWPFIKLNTDGCAKGQASLAAGGGIFRDSSSNILLAFSTYFGPMSSLEAEGWALLQGLRLAQDHKFSNLQVETDSRILFLSLTGQTLIPWRLRSLFRLIWNFLPLIHSFAHIYREANTVADSLANHGFNSRNFSVFQTRTDLPSHVKQIIRLDDLGLGSFRFKFV